MLDTPQRSNFLKTQTPLLRFIIDFKFFVTKSYIYRVNIHSQTTGSNLYGFFFGFFDNFSGMILKIVQTFRKLLYDINLR